MQYSKIIQTGTVGRQPTTGGSGFRAWTAFSFAIDSEKREDPTLWIDVICFGKAAEVVRSYVTSGSRIMVEGCAQSKVYNGAVKLGIKATDIRLIKTIKRDERNESEAIEDVNGNHGGGSTGPNDEVSGVGESTPKDDHEG